MRVPLEITYRDVPKTDEIDALIRSKAAKLDQFCDHIISCRVAVEKPHEFQQSGQPHRVRIEMRVPPGHTLVAKRESTEGEMHTDLHATIRQAFDAARRQLEKLNRQQQGRIKSHPEQETSAIVEKLFLQEGYGFLRTTLGRSIYFNKNSVLYGDFERMAIGAGVRFVEEDGEEGPQASTVQLIDKPARG
ncbi:MAG: HPF/RaiA family ribosome-associated protein [Desulfobacteraceae bacterium]|nr:MAG: HPF/RaiA family ribosome-associated protein [Desulfobacteraceae bacterium]